MHANFSPTIGGYSGQGAFRYWCQNVLPLTFDDSISYMELLAKVVTYLNNTISDVATAEENIDKLNTAFNQLQDYVNTYFDELDLEATIDTVLDNWVSDGRLQDVVEPFVRDEVNDELGGVVAEQIGATVAGQINDVVASQIGATVASQISATVAGQLADVVANQINAVVASQIGATVAGQIDDVVASQIGAAVTTPVSNWLTTHVDPVGSAVVVDNSLSISGAAADAKAVGDILYPIEETTNLYNPDGDNTVDGYYDRTNTFVSHATVRSTELVPVVAGKYYDTNLFGSTAFILWYNNQQDFIGSTNTVVGTPTQAPARACYARFSYNTSVEDTFYVVCCNAIRDFNINTKLLDWLTPMVNLFDSEGNNTTTGYYNRQNVLTEDADNRSTDYIPVVEGEYYASNTGEQNGFILWYSINYEPLGHTDTSINTPVPAVAKAAYARFVYKENYKNNLVIRGYHLSTPNTVAANKFKFTLPTNNLFDIEADNTTTGYYDRTNTFVTHDNIRTTDYIPVIVGGKYYTNLGGTSFVLYYNTDKVFLASGELSPNSDSMAPANACYAKFLFTELGKNNFYVGYKHSISELTNKINNIGNVQSNNPYDNLNAVAFGTSLTYRAQSTGGYLQYLPALSGMTFDNQGIGSSVILAYTGLASILNAVKSYTGYANKRVAILEGFVNDWYYNHSQTALGNYTDTTETTVCGCVRSAINYIMSQNANIRIFLVLDNYGKYTQAVDNSSTAVNQSGITQYAYYEEIAKVAESLGVPVVKGYAVSGISENTPQFLMDNIHPTTAGAQQFANCIWGVMREYYPNVVSS